MAFSRQEYWSGLLVAFSVYAEYIMQNARLDEEQVGIKIARRNMQMTPSFWQKREEELQSILIKVKKESEKSGVKLNIQKTKIMASGPITSWQRDGKQWKQ